jgi:AAA+ ATPase superfamily predicted ATPase
VGLLIYVRITPQIAFFLFMGSMINRFAGRKNELAQLTNIRKLKKASLIVVSGRRRIGKSTLIKEFSKQFKYFYEFQGLAPREAADNQSQLDHFAQQLKLLFGGGKIKFDSWSEAFEQLATYLTNRPALIFLDELSWMGQYDPDFAGRLKIAWDTKFSRIRGLVLVLCGSVSAWIEKNILNKTDFVGRVSLTLRLKELPLQVALNFWDEEKERSSFLERLNFLCIVGGVPKYLEEYDPRASCLDNIQRLCFTPGGYLFEDFDRVFSDIFGRRSTTYIKILRTIVNSHLTPQQMLTKFKRGPGGDITEALTELEQSGFVVRDYIFKPGAQRGKLSRLRISDNYLRFYLKYIEPNNERIRRGIFNFSNFSQLIAWEIIRALQFENLINNRAAEIISALNLDTQGVLAAGPYFQQATTKTKACQIDLLIEGKQNNFYICEMKYQKLISTKVIAEVKEKIAKIKLPKYSSRRPVLIYAGELDPAVIEADYFDIIYDLEQMDN